MILSSPARAGGRASAPAFTYLSPAAAAVALLGPRDCRWPLGEPGEAAFAFCGRPRARRGSYCEVHARLARPAAVRGGRA